MFLFKIMVAKVFRRNHATLRCMGGLLIILLLIAFLTIVQAFYRSLQGGNGQAEALDSRAEIIDGVYEILAFHIINPIL